MLLHRRQYYPIRQQQPEIRLTTRSPLLLLRYTRDDISFLHLFFIILTFRSNWKRFWYCFQNRMNRRRIRKRCMKSKNTCYSRRRLWTVRRTRSTYWYLLYDHSGAKQLRSSGYTRRASYFCRNARSIKMPSMFRLVRRWIIIAR